MPDANRSTSHGPMTERIWWKTSLLSFHSSFLLLALESLSPIRFCTIHCLHLGSAGRWTSEMKFSWSGHQSQISRATDRVACRLCASYFIYEGSSCAVICHKPHMRPCNVFAQFLQWKTKTNKHTKRISKVLMWSLFSSSISQRRSVISPSQICPQPVPVVTVIVGFSRDIGVVKWKTFCSHFSRSSAIWGVMGFKHYWSHLRSLSTFNLAIYNRLKNTGLPRPLAKQPQAGLWALLALW